MKKLQGLLMLFSAMAVIISCQKDGQLINTPQATVTTAPPLTAVDEITDRGSNKVDVCHKTGNGSYHVISVNVNALPAHLAHGDVRLDDPDGDGFVPYNECGIGDMGDCDDMDAAVNPGATEVCDNGIDDDCDHEIDEGCCDYFVNGCPVPDVCISDNNCFATVMLPVVIECNNVDLTVVSDLGAGFGPFDNVAPGTYDVTYTAEDSNNNQTACNTTLIVVDCKKPTPYCKNGIIIELMNVEPAVVGVTASDLNDNSSDNCAGNLQFSFSADPSDTDRTYTCDDIGQNTVEIWVTDFAGNQDFCTTSVIIQANMGQCD